MSDLTDRIDLAAIRLGGRVVRANDEFFGSKDNLIQPHEPIWIEGEYSERGKWMDGWETRRRREPGHDWCVIRLGLSGRIRGVVVDTSHFKGNYPEACSIEGCTIEPEAGEGSSVLRLPDALDWTELVPRTPLSGDTLHEIAVSDEGRYTHVRLNIYPDGGVARLRVFGDVVPDWDTIAERDESVDLAAVEHGARPISCSDKFFSDPRNLLMPGRGENMGDGWETRRRRGPGHDWVIIQLGRRGVIEQIEIDTCHFKGNYPDTCRLEVYDAGETSGLDEDAAGLAEQDGWQELLPQTKLKAHHQHYLKAELSECDPATHVRLSIYPDGGISRLRLVGRLA